MKQQQRLYSINSKNRIMCRKEMFIKNILSITKKVNQYHTDKFKIIKVKIITIIMFVHSQPTNKYTNFNLKLFIYAYIMISA